MPAARVPGECCGASIVGSVNPDRLQWIALTLGLVAFLSLLPQSSTLSTIALIPGLAAVIIGVVAVNWSGRTHASVRVPARVGIWAGACATGVGWITLLATT